MSYKSTAIITKEKKWFIARSVELGVTTQGKTVEEAKKTSKKLLSFILKILPKSNAI